MIFSPACSPPADYTQNGNFYYKLNTTTITFKEAKEVCRTDGAWIAMPKTASEFNIIKGK